MPRMSALLEPLAELPPTHWFSSGSSLIRILGALAGTPPFQRILEAMGITAALRKAGVKEGDTVFVGGTELAWSDEYRLDG